MKKSDYYIQVCNYNNGNPLYHFERVKGYIDDFNGLRGEVVALGIRREENSKGHFSWTATELTTGMKAMEAPTRALLMKKLDASFCSVIHKAINSPSNISAKERMEEFREKEGEQL